jgi:hypothetical protein
LLDYETRQARQDFRFFVLVIVATVICGVISAMV